MFTSLQPGARKLPKPAVFVSLLLHGLALGWLLHAALPKVLKPSFARMGNGGQELTRLYWPASDSAADPASLTEKARSKPKVVWHLQKKTAAAAKQLTHPPAVETPSTSSAGSSFGSSFDGTSHLEIRPALPVSTSDPVVDPGELKGGVEGDVIVEVTIDDHGNIVQKAVLKSLTPAIDNRVLAALENWHFLPATRDGVAIPSKQDVYYHFPR